MDIKQQQTRISSKYSFKITYIVYRRKRNNLVYNNTKKSCYSCLKKRRTGAVLKNFPSQVRTLTICFTVLPVNRDSGHHFHYEFLHFSRSFPHFQPWSAFAKPKQPHRSMSTAPAKAN